MSHPLFRVTDDPARFYFHCKKCGTFGFHNNLVYGLFLGEDGHLIGFCHGFLDKACGTAIAVVNICNGTFANAPDGDCHEFQGTHVDVPYTERKHTRSAVFIDNDDVGMIYIECEVCGFLNVTIVVVSTATNPDRTYYRCSQCRQIFFILEHYES